jgi:hypothetical protein
MRTGESKEGPCEYSDEELSSMKDEKFLTEGVTNLRNVILKSFPQCGHNLTYRYININLLGI